MPRVVCLLLLVLVPAPVLVAQGDSATAPAAPQNGAEAARLRAEVRERWKAHVRSALGLNDDQTARLDATEQRFEAQRQPLRAQQRDVNQALNAELSAAAPNQDRVKQLISARQEHQLKLQQLNRDEDREMQGYLTPVQRARYQDERRRFQERVAELVRQRQQAQRQQAPRRAPPPRPVPRRRKP